jgi:hypothetical protein
MSGKCTNDDAAPAAAACSITPAAVSGAVRDEVECGRRAFRVYDAAHKAWRAGNEAEADAAASNSSALVAFGRLAGSGLPALPLSHLRKDDAARLVANAVAGSLYHMPSAPMMSSDERPRDAQQSRSPVEAREVKVPDAAALQDMANALIQRFKRVRTGCGTDRDHLNALRGTLIDARAALGQQEYATAHTRLLLASAELDLVEDAMENG